MTVSLVSIVTAKFNAILVIMLLLKLHEIHCRIFTLCEFLAELRKLNVVEEKIGNYMCIADVISNFNTQNVDRSIDGSANFGVFQLSNLYWCSATGSKNYCQVPCYHSLDDDIADDLQCAQLIQQREGWEAWNTKIMCANKGLDFYTSRCH